MPLSILNQSSCHEVAIVLAHKLVSTYTHTFILRSVISFNPYKKYLRYENVQSKQNH